MKRIGRNEKCPCGSGKKYKKCHLGQKLEFSATTKKMRNVSIFRELIKDYRAEPILTFLSYIQLLPENHGHNFNIEVMAREVFQEKIEQDDRPFMSWHKLLHAVRAGQKYNSENPINLFTENVVSVDGNAIVFPGVFKEGAVILNGFLLVILTGENKLPHKFKQLVHSAAGLLLHMSNQVANDYGYSRYLKGNLSDSIVFPDYEKFIENFNRLSFSKEYLKEVAKFYNYDLSVLDDFLLSVNDLGVMDDDPEENVVSFKPLVLSNEEILLYMPTAAVSSLISFIHFQAEKMNCLDTLMRMVFEEQSQEAKMTLNHLGWLYTDINLPKPRTVLPLQESIWQFDNQKFGYLCLIDIEEMERAKKDFHFGNSLVERNSEVVDFLKSLEGSANFEVLSIHVLSETGHGSYFSMPKTEKSDQALVLTLSELRTIAYDTESDFLTLWKFASIYKITSERFNILNISGILNIYAFYRKNSGSLLHSDEGYPDGSILTYVPGYDINLRQEVKIAHDEHSTHLIVPTGQFGSTTVSRTRKFAPIYELKNNLVPEYRRSVECYRMPIWLTNYQKNSHSLAPEIVEALAFWLYRIKSDLAMELDKLSFIQFEIELMIDEKIFDGHKFVIKKIDPSTVKIISEIVSKKIQINIPYEFIYLMSRADNLGEKMLLKEAVRGLIKYVRFAGKDINLSEEEIEQMVEKRLQPSNAKMILFTDASTNVELDSRNLPKEYFITEVDTSYVLDNLVNYLPKNTLIPEKIVEVDEKISLCDTIVTGIIKELTTRIAEFDSEQLIEWLIKWNERCVYTREIREIRSPAKIACFMNFDEEVSEINEKDAKLVSTAHSIRTLIEFTAATLPKGEKWPNYADIGILLALTNQLTTWGSLSEAMRMRLAEPEIGLLPSGRIGTDKGFQNEVLLPYAFARNKNMVARFVEQFEKNYEPNYDLNANPTDESKILDDAFEDEFGITLTEVSEVVGKLINYGFQSEESCSKIGEVELFDMLQKELPEREEARLRKTVSLLTLLQRNSIGTAPKGYSSKDIFPWRFGRNLSYLRRPLAKVINKDGTFYYLFGFRHLKAFIDNLLFLIFTGKLPETGSEKMSSFIGGVLHDKGTPYRNEVANWLSINTDLQVIAHEVTIEPGGHIPAEKNYGDVDIMAVDHQNKIIYSLECKNLVGARNIHEMKVEVDIYLGREGQQAKAKINKHVHRDVFLKNHFQLVQNFLQLEDNQYSLVSIVVASDEMPLAYVAKESLPLPIISFSKIKEKGKDALKEAN